MGAPSTNSEPTDNRRSFAGTGSSSSKPLNPVPSNSVGSFARTGSSSSKPLNPVPSNSVGSFAGMSIPSGLRPSASGTGSSSSKPSLGEMKSGGLKTDKNVLTPINSEPSNSVGSFAGMSIPSGLRPSASGTGSSSSKLSLVEIKSGGLKTPTCNQVHRSTLEGVCGPCLRLYCYLNHIQNETIKNANDYITEHGLDAAKIKYSVNMCLKCKSIESVCTCAISSIYRFCAVGHKQFNGAVLLIQNNVLGKENLFLTNKDEESWHLIVQPLKPSPVVKAKFDALFGLISNGKTHPQCILVNSDHVISKMIDHISVSDYQKVTPSICVSNRAANAAWTLLRLRGIPLDVSIWIDAFNFQLDLERIRAEANEKIAAGNACFEDISRKLYESIDIGGYLCDLFNLFVGTCSKATCRQKDKLQKLIQEISKGLKAEMVLESSKYPDEKLSENANIKDICDFVVKHPEMSCSMSHIIKRYWRCIMLVIHPDHGGSSDFDACLTLQRELEKFLLASNVDELEKYRRSVVVVKRTTAQISLLLETASSAPREYAKAVTSTEVISVQENSDAIVVFEEACSALVASGTINASIASSLSALHETIPEEVNQLVKVSVAANKYTCSNISTALTKAAIEAGDCVNATTSTQTAITASYAFENVRKIGDIEFPILGSTSEEVQMTLSSLTPEELVIYEKFRTVTGAEEGKRIIDELDEQERKMTEVSTNYEQGGIFASHANSGKNEIDNTRDKMYEFLRMLVKFIFNFVLPQQRRSGSKLNFKKFLEQFVGSDDSILNIDNFPRIAHTGPCNPTLFVICLNMFNELGLTKAVDNVKKALSEYEGWEFIAETIDDEDDNDKYVNFVTSVRKNFLDEIDPRKSANDFCASTLYQFGKWISVAFESYYRKEFPNVAGSGRRANRITPAPCNLYPIPTLDAVYCKLCECSDDTKTVEFLVTKKDSENLGKGYTYKNDRKTSGTAFELYIYVISTRCIDLDLTEEERMKKEEELSEKGLCKLVFFRPTKERLESFGFGTMVDAINSRKRTEILTHRLLVSVESIVVVNGATQCKEFNYNNSIDSPVYPIADRLSVVVGKDSRVFHKGGKGERTKNTDKTVRIEDLAKHLKKRCGDDLDFILPLIGRTKDGVIVEFLIGNTEEYGELLHTFSPELAKAKNGKKTVYEVCQLSKKRNLKKGSKYNNKVYQEDECLETSRIESEIVSILTNSLIKIEKMMDGCDVNYDEAIVEIHSELRQTLMTVKSSVLLENSTANDFKENVFAVVRNYFYGRKVWFSSFVQDIFDEEVNSVFRPSLETVSEEVCLQSQPTEDAKSLFMKKVRSNIVEVLRDRNNFSSQLVLADQLEYVKLVNSEYYLDDETFADLLDQAYIISALPLEDVQAEKLAGYVGIYLEEKGFGDCADLSKCCMDNLKDYKYQKDIEAKEKARNEYLEQARATLIVKTEDVLEEDDEQFFSSSLFEPPAAVEPIDRKAKRQAKLALKQVKEEIQDTQNVVVKLRGNEEKKELKREMKMMELLSKSGKSTKVGKKNSNYTRFEDPCAYSG